MYLEESRRVLNQKVIRREVSALLSTSWPCAPHWARQAGVIAHERQEKHFSSGHCAAAWPSEGSRGQCWCLFAVSTPAIARKERLCAILSQAERHFGKAPGVPNSCLARSGWFEVSSLLSLLLRQDCAVCSVQGAQVREEPRPQEVPWLQGACAWVQLLSAVCSRLYCLLCVCQV